MGVGNQGLEIVCVALKRFWGCLWFSSRSQSLTAVRRNDRGILRNLPGVTPEIRGIEHPHLAR